jgi:hypothetical protein
MKCRVINCTKEAIEEHHITYYPEATTLMCSEHHEQITAINSHQARKQHHKFVLSVYTGKFKKTTNNTFRFRMGE